MKKAELIIFSLLFFSINIFAQSNKILCQKGVLDIRNVDFDNIESIKIEGEYEFFWNQLLTPQDFANQVIMPDAYILQPGSWKNLIINEKKLPAQGKATLRIVIFANPSQTPYLTFVLKEILTAYKAWFNGELIAQVGNVQEPPNFKPGLRPIAVTQKINNQRNELIIQIANYKHRNNAIDEAPEIGKPENIQKSFFKNLASDLIILGIVLIMSFYHLGLFFFRRKNKAALIFAIFTLIIFVRIIVTGKYVLNYFFDFVSWNFTYRMAYFTYYMAVPVFVNFFFILFDEAKKQKNFIYASYLASILFSITILFSAYFFSTVLIFYQIITLIQIVYVFYFFFKYIKQKKESVIILVLGFSALLLTAINDILYYQDIIKTTTLLPFGIFLLILSQALALAKKFTNAFIINEKLNEELDYQNKHLEELVKDRTKEIEKQKQEILQKNEELLQINEELVVQKEEIIRQRDMLEEQNLFIKDSINYASLIQKSLLPDNEELSKYFSTFIIYQPKNVVSGDFYWISDYQPNYIYFAVGDCTGHGVPGAFISIISIYLLNNIVNQQQVSTPGLILDTFDILFKQHLHKVSSKVPDGITISLIRFEKNNFSKIVYSCSKQSFAIYNSQNKQIIRFKGSPRSIGIDTRASEKNFEDNILEINKNDVLYLFSDGYTDQNNEKRERFGTKKFLNFLSEIADLPLPQQKVALIRQLEDYRTNQPNRDDITVVALKPKN